jgi:hypothetical protein
LFNLKKHAKTLENQVILTAFKTRVFDSRPFLWEFSLHWKKNKDIGDNDKLLNELRKNFAKFEEKRLRLVATSIRDSQIPPLDSNQVSDSIRDTQIPPPDSNQVSDSRSKQLTQPLRSAMKLVSHARDPERRNSATVKSKSKPNTVASASRDLRPTASASQRDSQSIAPASQRVEKRGIASSRKESSSQKDSTRRTSRTPIVPTSRDVIKVNRRIKPVAEESRHSEDEIDDDNANDDDKIKPGRTTQVKRSVPVIGSIQNNPGCERCENRNPPRQCWQQAGGRGACFGCGKLKVKCSLRNPTPTPRNKRKKVIFRSPSENDESDNTQLPPSKRQRRSRSRSSVRSQSTSRESRSRSRAGSHSETASESGSNPATRGILTIN